MSATVVDYEAALRALKAIVESEGMRVVTDPSGVGLHPLENLDAFAFVVVNEKKGRAFKAEALFSRALMDELQRFMTNLRSMR